MNKHYLTVEQTRIYALDNPIGDAWGYGKPQMPIAVVALAASSFAAGVTAFAAATTMAGMVAAGAVIAGSALTIIGTVTGNQKLAKIGGIIAIVGGVANLAMSATNAAGSAASTATDAASTAASDAATNAAADAAGGLIPEYGSEAVYNAAVKDAVPGLTVEMGAEAASTAPATTRGMLNAAPEPVRDLSKQAADSISKQAPGTPVQPLDATNTEVGQSLNTNVADSGATEVGSANKQNAFATGPDQSAAETARLARQNATLGVANDPGMMAKFEAWSKANPQMAKMLMEGGKGMLGSLVSSPRDEAMIQYYQNNADAIKRKAMWGSGRIA